MYRILLSPAKMQSWQVEHLVWGPVSGIRYPVCSQSLSTSLTRLTWRYGFLIQSTLRAISYTMQNRTLTWQYPVILVPEAINPERVIRYAMQNRMTT